MKLSSISQMIVLISLFSSPAFADCNSKATKEHTKAGLLAYEQQDCASVLNELSQSVGDNCKDGLIFFRMAVCSEITGSSYSAQQYYQLAEPLLVSLKKASPYQRDFFQAYGRFLYTKKKWDEALRYLNQASLRGESNFALYYMLGEILINKGDLAQAANYFQQALTQDVSQVSPAELGKAHKVIMIVAYQNNDFENAKLALQNAKTYLTNDKELKNYEINIQLGLDQLKINEMIKNVESRRNTR